MQCQSALMANGNGTDITAMRIDAAKDKWVHRMSTSKIDQLANGCCVGLDELIELDWNVIWMC